jgi:DNA-binding XRE family transcriptional regulator
VDKALKTYVSTEREVKKSKPDLAWCESLRKLFESKFSKISTATVSDVFKHARPRTSKGAFAGSSRLSIPYHIYKDLPDSVVGTVPKSLRAFSGYFKPYPSAKTKIVENRDENVAEVLFVPKDSRGPRVISKEPLHLLRAQLSYFDFVSDNLQRISRNRINFTDQSINRQLAHQSSVHRDYCTIDLKEASDRVSLLIVQRIFRNSPIRWFFQYARSTHASLPTGDIIPLGKLSGMGSGLTFPTMALVIFLSIVQSVHDGTGHDINNIMDHVYVYGDDVIVPTKWYSHARNGLIASGLMVNEDKSFYASHFRESCGGDYYKGYDVTPVRLRLSNAGLIDKDLSRDSKCFVIDNDMGLYQLNRSANNAYKAGLYYTSKTLHSACRKSGYPYPEITGESSVFGTWVNNITHRDISVLCARPVPKIRQHNGSCPFKFLKNFFNRSPSDTRFNFVEALGGSKYGEFATPHAFKLKVCNTPSIVLR